MRIIRHFFMVALLITFVMSGAVPIFGDVFPGDVIPEEDPWCDPEPLEPTFEPAIRVALDAEALAIGIISTLPEPIPSPLLQIPREFKKIALDVIEARSWSLVATLPVPIPGPNKAIAAQNRALHRAEQLEAKINNAVEKGWLLAGEADELTSDLALLESLISTLPQPIP